MGLREYRGRRHFQVTPEPSGKRALADEPATGLTYVVQKHWARRLHYDFRLEWRGVLLSWAIPKGPSVDPSVKRLAVRTEDHPLDYAHFEGVIPEGEYGAGTVSVWDEGTWAPDDPDVDSALQSGLLKFILYGKKLKGSWVLVRTRRYEKRRTQAVWLLIKQRDPNASTEGIDGGSALGSAEPS
jgi:bifunctional non-homologous end joining protein LigD